PDGLTRGTTDVGDRTGDRLEAATRSATSGAVGGLAQLLQLVHLLRDLLLLRQQLGILLFLLLDQRVQRGLLLVVGLGLVAGGRDLLLLAAGQLVERGQLAEEVLRAARGEQRGDVGPRATLVEPRRQRAHPGHRQVDLHLQRL